MTGPPSDHFNGKTFFFPGQSAARGLRDLLKWKLTSRARPWPDRVEVARQALPTAPSEGVAATLVGHATVLLRTATASVLTDPIFSKRASPVAWLGPRRVAAPGVAFDDLPRTDAVLLSHDHYDHCDLASLRRLARRDDPVVVAPLGFRPLLAGAGLRRIVELDWWQSHRLSGGEEATLVPALHWCRRRPFATNIRLWGGFVMALGGRRVYFAGDSGYHETLFREIGRRCGPPDLSLIPIGAYEPRWFMRDAHMNPPEAVRVHQDVGSRRSVAIHWGVFQLTDEGYEDPPKALAEACRGAGLPRGAFEAPPPGTSILL
ncbi:MAG TPA: MBL fold metallo-hydrolase [Opitutaceae bacterium]|jgi:L-ascorbate metabolism protein UlaG (beta-lactamase superfamily)